MNELYYMMGYGASEYDNKKKKERKEFEENLSEESDIDEEFRYILKEYHAIAINELEARKASEYDKLWFKFNSVRMDKEGIKRWLGERDIEYKVKRKENKVLVLVLFFILIFASLFRT